MIYTFPKAEKLCSRKLIEKLYAEGHRLRTFPFSIQWIVTDAADHIPCQVMIVAPKRVFHHAVDRNRVKRLVRECWRLRKQDFYSFLQERGLCVVVSFVYTHGQILDYAQLGHKMDKALATLKEDITAHL